MPNHLVCSISRNGDSAGNSMSTDQGVLDNLPLPNPNGVGAQLSKPGEHVKVTLEQEKVLEQTFKENRNVDELTITIVAAETGLPEDKAKKWFQNRQALWRVKEGLNPNSRSIND